MAMPITLNTKPFSTGFEAVQNFISREIAAFNLTSARVRAFRETKTQLEALSNRDLADIGISRCAIQGIARDEAMKVTLK
ncbi:MAG: DUF1127 domain-containing protein [Rhodobacterales bacterium]|nr:DUF1127 domain-containing protein [Pseudomonadota bacterium]MDA1285885.1 DUF1127 domain-containing protein [Pseudomonadota bacterium]